MHPTFASVSINATYSCLACWGGDPACCLCGGAGEASLSRLLAYAERSDKNARAVINAVAPAASTRIRDGEYQITAAHRISCGSLIPDYDSADAMFVDRGYDRDAKAAARREWVFCAIICSASSAI